MGSKQRRSTNELLYGILHCIAIYAAQLNNYIHCCHGIELPHEN